MGMTLTKSFVNNCRNIGALRDFLCQAMDQVDEKDKEIAELKEQYKDMDVTHTVHIAKMNALIEELEESQRWRKCSEELPEDGAEVLATDGEEIWLCHKDTVCDGSPWFQPDGLPHIEGVTHWKPLPSAPKEEK